MVGEPFDHVEPGVIPLQTAIDTGQNEPAPLRLVLALPSVVIRPSGHGWLGM